MDTLSEAPMHEFCLLERLDDDEEAYKRAAALIGLHDDFAPVNMGDSTPYVPCNAPLELAE